MFVVVAGTIVAPVSESTTWTVVPVTISPDVGWTIVTTAGDDGPAPDACGAEAVAAGAASRRSAPSPRATPEHATHALTRTSRRRRRGSSPDD